MANRVFINSLYFGSLLFKPSFFPKADIPDSRPSELLLVTQALPFGECRCPTPGEGLSRAHENMCTQLEQAFTNHPYDYRLLQIAAEWGFLPEEAEDGRELRCLADTQCEGDEKICEYNNINTGGGYMRHFPRYRFVEPNPGSDLTSSSTSNSMNLNGQIFEQDVSLNQRLQASRLPELITDTGGGMQDFIRTGQELYKGPQGSILYSWLATEDPLTITTRNNQDPRSMGDAQWASHQLPLQQSESIPDIRPSQGTPIWCLGSDGKPVSPHTNTAGSECIKPWEIWPRDGSFRYADPSEEIRRIR
ncbi:uncharacterized protein PAC_08059 [Phialocephala subalpina]|uniref:Uncharacterized protein n=1 Tax=Phialocephala subalpina TaxID=576137 RepID=A0A1L7WZH6_9HELO|nr:uncharacterized protein PAC_08059 [Phialocephala subalpina]